MFRSDAGTIQSHQVNRDCVRHPLRDSEDHLYEIKLCKKLRELVERKSFIQEVDGSIPFSSTNKIEVFWLHGHSG
jgi:hypothetical protein